MPTSARFILVNDYIINTKRLCNLLRNSPPDCFSQICKYANLEQLVVGSNNC